MSYFPIQRANRGEEGLKIEDFERTYFMDDTLPKYISRCPCSQIFSQSITLSEVIHTLRNAYFEGIGDGKSHSCKKLYIKMEKPYQESRQYS